MSVETLQQNTWLLNCSTDKWQCVHVKLCVSLFPCTGWYNLMAAYSIMVLIFNTCKLTLDQALFFILLGKHNPSRQDEMKTSSLLAQLLCKRACLKAEMPSSKLSVGSYKVQGCSF